MSPPTTSCTFVPADPDFRAGAAVQPGRAGRGGAAHAAGPQDGGVPPGPACQVGCWVGVNAQQDGELVIVLWLTAAGRKMAEFPLDPPVRWAAVVGLCSVGAVTGGSVVVNTSRPQDGGVPAGSTRQVGCWVVTLCPLGAVAGG